MNMQPVIETAEAMPAKSDADKFLVRVESPGGKLLFHYNTTTDSIEIKDDGITYRIGVKDLRSQIFSSIFSRSEAVKLKAEKDVPAPAAKKTRKKAAPKVVEAEAEETEGEE